MKTLRHLRIMAAAVLLLLFACRQEITTIDDHNSKREQVFFRNNATPTARNFGQIAGQISHLREINSKTEFISKLSDKAGLPKWGFSMTTAIGTPGKSGRTADADVLIIPMQEDANSYLSSLLYVERPGSDNPTIYTVTNLELYDFVRNSDIDAGIREQILSTFMYFDNLVYGNKDFAHLPADLYSEIPLKEGESSKSFTIASSEVATTQELHNNGICIIDVHCTRQAECDYGRNCDLCTRYCADWYCFSTGGGGYEGPISDGPGDTGDPGDGGGTGTGTGSGECSRGGWYRIIPPGCPGGGDEELPPAVLALKGAMLNLGAQFDIFAYEGYLTYNVSIAQKFNTYLLQNNNPQGAAFVMWGLEFLSQNTSTTWVQFENWFMGKSEGKAGEDYDSTFWDNPNLTFPKQNLPTWENYYNAFPKDANGKGLPGPAIYELVKGTPKALRDGVLNDSDPSNDEDYDNACALRVSIALNYSGVIIPNLPNQTFKGADGKYYFLSAKKLNIWMRKTFGTNPATSSTPFNANHVNISSSQAGVNGVKLPKLLSRIKGIYSLVSSDPTWASGHGDILQSNGICINGCHFFDAPIAYIDVWKLQ